MRTSRRAARLLALVLAGVLVLAACGDDDDTSTTDTTAADTTQTTTGDTTDTSAAEVAEGEPIKIGFLNIVGTTAFDFFDYSDGVESAVEYLNNDAGGVDGRPIDLLVCEAQGTPESTQACAQQFIEDGVLAVGIGIDIAVPVAQPVLQAAGIPIFGMTPILPQEFSADFSLYWGAGNPGIMPAIAQYAADEGYQKVAIVTTDNAAAVAALPLLKGPLDTLGIPYAEVQGRDGEPSYDPIVQAADAEGADAWIVLASGNFCSGVMASRAKFAIDTPVLTTGLCRSNAVIEGAGGEEAATGWSFAAQSVNVGADATDPEALMFREGSAEYNPGGVVDIGGFYVPAWQLVFTLATAMEGAGVDGLTGQALYDHVKANPGPVFLTGGIDWACGSVPGFPAVCNTDVFIYTKTADGFEDATGGTPINAIGLLG
ncbi:MAG: ABC transporter substrate-binding protein [Acidimicrobiales bacterium]|nr:ABC transporter substrate-binding protein [Acidimicrobiales bacterium]